MDPPALAPRIAVADSYSTTCGDAFHYHDRAKVPIKHLYKKAYKVALRDAWFVPHPEVQKVVEDVPITSKLTKRSTKAGKGIFLQSWTRSLRRRLKLSKRKSKL